MDTRLHCVYLLVSLDPNCKDHCYIGYTTNPLRRLRQHNGDIANGAWRTSRRGRPWKLVAFVSGFPEDRMGLKFEWCWQHPAKALMVREALASGPPDAQRALHKFLTSQGTSINRAPYAVSMLHVLLRCDMFRSLCLRLNIVDDELWDRYTAPLYKAAPAPTPHGGAVASISGIGFPSLTQPLPAVPPFGLALLSPFPAVHPLLHVVHVSTEEIEALLPNTSGGIMLSQLPPSSMYHTTSASGHASHNELAAGDRSAAPSFLLSLMGSSATADASRANSKIRGQGGRGGGGELSISSIAIDPNNTNASNSSVRINWSHALEHEQSAATFAADDSHVSTLPQHTPTPLCTFCALPLMRFETGATQPPVMLCQRPAAGTGVAGCQLAAHVTCLAVWFHLNVPDGNPTDDDPTDVRERSFDAAYQHSTPCRQPTTVCASQPTIIGGGPGRWTLVPRHACVCPLCGYELHWSIGVQQLKQRTNAVKSLQLARRREVLDATLEARMAAIGGQPAAKGGRGLKRGGGRGGGTGGGRSRGVARGNAKRARSDDDHSEDTHVQSARRQNDVAQPAPTSAGEAEVEQPDWWLDL